MFNKALYPLVDGDEFLVYQMHRVFREKWPQFNEQTKIHSTQERVIYISEYQPRRIDDDMIQQPIPAGRLFRFWLFNRSIPDDFDGRWNYQKTLFIRAVNIPRYALMRFVGRLFNRPRIIQATMEWTINPSAPIMPESRTEIRLERFGWRIGEVDQLDPYGNMTYIDAGYYPAKDTLFVRTRGKQ